jgi:hypothetical protein
VKYFDKMDGPVIPFGEGVPRFVGFKEDYIHRYGIAYFTPEKQRHTTSVYKLVRKIARKKITGKKITGKKIS